MDTLFAGVVSARMLTVAGVYATVVAPRKCNPSTVKEALDLIQAWKNQAGARRALRSDEFPEMVLGAIFEANGQETGVLS